MSFLRNLEKSMIRTIMRFIDINYLTKYEELGKIPVFLKFKPPKLLVYDNNDKFHRKVLLKQSKIARTQYNGNGSLLHERHFCTMTFLQGTSLLHAGRLKIF